MVLPDGRPVLGRGIFGGDAWPHHFGKAVDVDRLDRERGFDLRAHGLGPGLRAEDADAKRGRCGVDAASPEFVEQGEHVARRHHDDVGPERSEEHTSELQSLMRISYAVFCLKKKKYIK